ncbi:hypothetical protein ASF49_16025 [Methylobacterium sp. Leaf104]|uniref:GspMb/PilO family protein n=1 Tax=Methylobacterium TaxID=407 RepID=UPI00070222C1|nr:MULTISPECIES: GspMb/PilO family protein [Methylobacterium]KQP29665.1 hypothetical protein ASF49_16025 [Methylobacterium sp. Leaf104]MCI9881787.1 hypothetical protein [Methylobacterium goesingense]
MTIDLPGLLRGRLGALLLLGLAVAAGAWLLAQALGDVREADEQIAGSRALLARTRAAANRPAPPAPLWGTDEAALLAAFRTRLDGLAADRAVLLDETRLERDAERPTAPRLAATLRGTTEGLHGLLLALETQTPLAVVETADLSALRPAEPEAGWPTVMRLSLSLRGALAAPPADTVGSGR